MTELRWILLGLGLLLMAAIWWWMTRRSGQARGPGDVGSAVRGGSTLRDGGPRPPDAQRPRDGGVRPPDVERPVTREWSVSPLDPLTVKTRGGRGAADLELPVMSGGRAARADDATSSLPMSAAAAPLPVADALPPMSAAPPPAAAPPPTATPPSSAAAPPPAAAPVAVAPAARAVAPDASPPAATIPAVAPPSRAPDPTASQRPGTPTPPSVSSSPTPNPAERQRIVTVRVSAAGPSGWPGERLAAAFESHGLTFGRYQVFHRKHADGRSLFCVASLVEPGTFDPAQMHEAEFPGVTLFAVLPGPATPLQALDGLLATARELAESLGGSLQDGKGQPMSPQRVAALREDVARFQASLP